jgi:hypothetical protein
VVFSGRSLLLCWRAIEEFFHWVSFDCYVIVLQVEEPVFSLLDKEFVFKLFFNVGA